MTTLDPWGAVKIDNYSKLFDEFGISRFDDLLGRIPDPHRYMRRHVIFGHRSYESILDAMLSGKPFAAMSGFMPSGKAHLGHKMVMEEIIWHQQHGGDAFLAIADMEAHAVRGVNWEKCRELGINEYVLSAIALGFEPGGHIYFQSSSAQVKDLAFELGIKANFSEMSAIYGFNGETNIAHMISALTQSADILQPQLKEFGGPKPVVIPVGADQDPHIRLTRGLAEKVNWFNVFAPDTERSPHGTHVHIYSKIAPQEAFDALNAQLRKSWKIISHSGHIDVLCDPAKTNETMDYVKRITEEIEIKYGGYGFLPPASTYHKFMTGLQGGKMSSSIPESYIALTEEPEEGAKKVLRAKTGGRVTLEEQKKLGGEPEQCTVYELLLYHLIENDDELLEIYKDCIGGTRVCGKCKKHAAELMRQFLKDHQEKRELARERLSEFGLKL
jgi:tryptophanyl-tRNA synthetase